MRTRLRRWWPTVKVLLGVVILVLVGRRFALDLRELFVSERWRGTFHVGWAVLSGLLYLGGLFFSALTWYRLLGHFGERPRLWTAVRAYYLGHLGKYLPGKAWALFLRADLVRGDGVRVRLAALTAFYEVLVTMSAGALLAAALFAALAPDAGASLDWPALRGLLRLEAPPGGVLNRHAAVTLSLLLLSPILVPILPPVFNRIIERLALPFRDSLAGPLPRFRAAYLAEGLLLTSAEWLLHGASLAAALCAVLGTGLPWTAEAAGRLPALMGVSYVAGFLVVVAPSGLGVREFFLTLFLTPELETLLAADPVEARGLAVLAVLVLRLAWTAAEMLTAAVVYPLRPRTPAEGAGISAADGVS